MIEKYYFSFRGKLYSTWMPRLLAEYLKRRAWQRWGVTKQQQDSWLRSKR